MEKVADPRETTPALLEYARTPMWSSPPTTIRETDFVRQHHTTHDLYEERTRSWCFWTGLAYWIVILCDGTAELGVRRRFINYDSHMDTATKIRHNPDTFRRQIILEVVACLADTIVAVSLSGLLISLSMGTNSRSSSTTTLPPPDDSSPLPIIGAGIFRFLQQTIRMGNVLLLMAICLLLDETFHPVMPVASAINNTDRNSQDVAAKWAFFYVTLHSYGQVLAQMWLGISLTTWGCCALAIHLQHNSMDNNDTTTTTTNSKNSMIPQWIITLLILAGVGYLLDGIGFFGYPIIQSFPSPHRRRLLRCRSPPIPPVPVRSLCKCHRYHRTDGLGCWPLYWGNVH